MNIFKAAAPRKVNTFAILGLGIFGSTVAKELMRFGNHVIGVDQDEGRVMAHADVLTQAMLVDVRDDAALREAGIGECDSALVAVGDDLEASILAAINLKTLGVQQVWAKATSKTHHRILSRLKVDRVIHPEVEVGQQIAQVLHNPLVRDSVALGNGYRVVNFMIPVRMSGMTLSKLRLAEFDVQFLGAMRGTEFLGNDPDSLTFKTDDRVILLGKRADLRSFSSSDVCR